MGELRKAQMQRLGSGTRPTPQGDPIQVQFNPTSLRLQMSNSFDGGTTRSRQSRQYQGNSSTTLTVELVFDTSDEGTTERPRNVKEKTNRIARFLLPDEGSQAPPPRVRFQWGDFILDGILSEMTEDIDLFSSGGVPLRSKVQITIKEQDSRFTALASGAGASTSSGASKPGDGTGKPGTKGSAKSDRTGAALADESAADFAARNGLDPGAWRAITGLTDDPLTLPLGAEVDFSASISAGAGIGLSAGFEAGISESLEVSLGLDTGEVPSLAAGVALTAAGGTGAAINAVQSSEAEHAATAARNAFEAPAASGGTKGTPSDDRSPLHRDGGLPTPREQAAAPGAPLPAAVDPRAISFGAGVPLRPVVSPGIDDRDAAVSGRTVVGAKPTGETAPTAVSAGTPSWERLPVESTSRDRADAAQDERAPARPCGCRRRCGHRRAWA